LFVAPDNALYAFSKDEVSSTTYTYNAGGTVDLMGEPYVQDNGVLQVMNDATADVSDLELDGPIDIEGVIGTFIYGEVLKVIGDSLNYTPNIGSVVDEAVGTGDGVEDTFSLDNTPVMPGSLTVYIDGTPQTETTDYTVDYVAGEITFTTAPAGSEVITASYDYVAGAGSLTGDVQVMGVTSGATGWFNVDGLFTANPLLDTWAPVASTVTVTSSSMFVGAPIAEYTYTNIPLSGTWTAGETLDVTGFNILGSDVDETDDTVTLEGASSGNTVTIAGDETETGVQVSGDSFDADEVVTVTGSDVTVAESSSSSTSEPTYMHRLLLHQADNIWEDTYNPYMQEMWYSEGSNLLWAEVDEPGYDDTLEAFEDFLSGPVQDVTATEVNASAGNATKSVSVSWTQLNGAEEYLVMAIASPTNVVAGGVTVPTGTVAGDTLTTVIPGLDPATEYTIMVRVSDGEPYQSRWSAPASVTTEDYILPPVPEVPAQGLQGAPLLPSFVWQSASGAVSYDFQLSTSPDFSSLLVDTNVTATGYTASTELAYDTNHYWRVRSVAADNTVSAWCSVQNFHTRTEEQPQVTIPPQETPTVILPTPTVVIPDITVNPPAITVEPPAVTVPIPASTVTEVNPVIQMPESKTPVFIWIIVAIGAVLTIAVIVLIIRTRRVV
jgi:hypothetical protein